MGGFLGDNFYTNDACKNIMKKLVTKSLYTLEFLNHLTIHCHQIHYLYTFLKVYE